MRSTQLTQILFHRASAVALLVLGGMLANDAGAQPSASVESEKFDDHQHMMKQLGIKSLRPGADPNKQDTFDEAKANPYHDSMPDPLTMNDGTKVTSPAHWPTRRAELVELFEREVYGRIPPKVPKISWEITATTEGQSGGIPTITRTLVGRVDNSAYPEISVNIEAKFTVHRDTDQPRPIMIEFDAFGGRFGPRPGTVPWSEQAIAHGWAYGTINPGSIQPDNNNFRAGIIGLTNKGQPRKPDDWGALRAWGWGVGQLIDFFAAHPELKIDPKKVGIEGVSRYGKAALVTQAFDERVAVAFVASSGEGGAKLHRHIFGEALENLTGGGYYWMAGNFMKYGAAEAEFGAKTAADLPVDSHELIALCAPRPCFISYGIVERGDPHWVDARGSFMAGVLAGPVYRLLGKQDFGTAGDYLTDPMPPVNQLIGGELAWRQHDGGHEAGPNWPTFFDWVAQYIQAPPPPQGTAAAAADHSGPPGADQPVPRTDENSKIAHDQLVAKAKAGGIDLYFLGDSITRRWGCTDPQWAELLANWKKNFFGWNAGNFGWGADGIQNMLWRIQNGELDGVRPKVIVVLAGTNNVGNQPGGERKVADILKGFRALINTCREKAPEAKIIVTAIFPRNDNPAVLPEIRRINGELAKLADDQTIFYLNVNDKLADANGMLFEGMTIDKLHLSVKGYQVWADGLHPLLTKFLGPRAQTDTAPPPTGDPSVVPSAENKNPR
jgi:lysophospholipase L1-like esterase